MKNKILTYFQLRHIWNVTSLLFLPCSIFACFKAYHIKRWYTTKETPNNNVILYNTPYFSIVITMTMLLYGMEKRYFIWYSSKAPVLDSNKHWNVYTILVCVILSIRFISSISDSVFPKCHLFSSPPSSTSSGAFTSISCTVSRNWVQSSASCNDHHLMSIYIPQGPNVEESDVMLAST